LKDPTNNAALIEKYDAVPYEGQSNALSHPDTMAAVARLHGLEPPPIARCRVLEVGCSEGANLLPMAATLPEAMFVGCDLSPRAIDAASRAVADLGLSNVILHRADLRELPATLGEFDYIIAHGVYSWVPAPVRDALFDHASRCLSRNGLMFVSYNTYPGCHVRRAAWEIMHRHIDAIEGAAARLDAARVLCKALGEPAMTQVDSDAALRGEFLRLARQSDSALCHDDLAQPNDPVYFRDFVAHAERHGLQFLAEAKLSMMSDAGVAPGIRQLLAGMDRLSREQYLDFARLRRFRSSLLCRARTGADFVLRPDRLANLLVCASSGVVRAAAEGKLAQVTAASSLGIPDPNQAADANALLRWLVEIFPRTPPVSEVREWHRERLEKQPRGTPPPPSVEALLLEACISGVVEAHVWTPALVCDAGERPLASPVARWQARNGEQITNLRHETLTLKDVSARRLLALLDGTRTRDTLAKASSEALAGGLPGDGLIAGVDLDDYLNQFAKHALLLR